MGKLVSGLGALAAYFCIATVLAIALMASWAWNSGKLNPQKASLIAAIIQDLPLPATVGAQAPAPATKQVSATIDDLENARASRFRQLELRELALENGLKQVRFEKDKLDEEKTRFETAYNKFVERLGADKTAAVAQGSENARLLLESVKPKQSKELIMLMLKAEETEAVVTLFSAMPIAKRAKIAAEFKTPEETAKLDEIVRRIRLGEPEVDLLDETARTIAQPSSAKLAP